jgi:hypothetical protein
LRHKRALKALLGKVAEATTDFMGRNRRLRAQYASYLKTRDTPELKIGKGFAGAHGARFAIARTMPARARVNVNPPFASKPDCVPHAGFLMILQHDESFI